MEPSEPPRPCRTVSVVTPVFNEQECVQPFYRRTRAALEACGVEAFEMIFIDDGSTDQTPMFLSELAAQDPAVKVLTLSRNFGHHPAVFAGLAFATGDVTIIIDADLQDPPELIPALLAERNRGYRLILARRRHSEDPWWMATLKWGFRALMRRIAEVNFPTHVGVFSAMDRSFKDLLLSMPERQRYLLAMQMYLGFRVGTVEYSRARRIGGKPKQSLGRLFRLGMNSLFSYSSLPLRVSMLAGFICLFAALLCFAYILYAKFVWRVAIPGWASVMTAILGMGSIQLLSLWIVCEYVDRIFENTKGRPYYVVWEQVGQFGMGQDAMIEQEGRR